MRYVVGERARRARPGLSRGLDVAWFAVIAWALSGFAGLVAYAAERRTTGDLFYGVFLGARRPRAGPEVYDMVGLEESVNASPLAITVYRDERGALSACSAACTHAGCLFAWNDDAKPWDCPCHGSRFDPRGKVIKRLRRVEVVAPDVAPRLDGRDGEDGEVDAREAPGRRAEEPDDARRRSGFSGHLLAYVLVNALLAAGNLMSGGPLWFLLVVLGWGIGLAFHARAAYAPDRERLTERVKRRAAREREAEERRRRKREAEERARRIGKAVGVVDVLKSVADAIDPARKEEAAQRGTGVRVTVDTPPAREPHEAARDASKGEAARRGER